MHHCVLESDLLDGHIFVYGCLLKLVWCGIAPLQRVLLHMSFGHNDSDDDIFGEGTLATEPVSDLEPASVVEELADQSAPQEPPPPEGSCTIIAADDTSGSEDLWSQVRAKPGRKPRRERTANQKLAASLGQLAAAAAKVATLKQAGSADNSASAFVRDATPQVPQLSGVTESATPQKLVETYGLGDRLTAFLKAGGFGDDYAARFQQESGMRSGLAASAQPEAEPDATASAKPEAQPDATASAKPARAARGAAGTFAGRRPPKDPAKLLLFEAKKSAFLSLRAHERENREATTEQKAFWKFMSDKLKEAGGTTGFKDAAQEWGSIRKRPAAAAPTSTPKKELRVGHTDLETPEKKDDPKRAKEVDQPSRSSGASASSSSAPAHIPEGASEAQ